MKELQVGLGDRAYPIRIEHGLLANIGEDLAQRHVGNRYCVIADSNVAGLYAGRLLDSLQKQGLVAELITFAAGEESKNLQTFTDVCRRMAELRFDRKDAVIALGGGVSGDLAGFAAASYMRGVPFVQVPTTLLAQVDSSVGGKTAVDIPEGKNLVGAFYQPRAVYIDPDVLKTLDHEELLGGIAEVVKYGVIRDASFFAFLQERREDILALQADAVDEVIATCCRIKADVVAEDERESDLRRILNFGHTIGHAVESASEFSLIHGKAVSIGMVAASRIAVRKGLLPREAAGELIELLKAFGLPVEVPQQYGLDELQKYILSDKKAISGTVPYILPRALGDVVITTDVDADDLAYVLMQPEGF